MQLHWALNFLRGIHNKGGLHPKDVEICIQAIEDQLIDQYASMVEPNKPEKQKGSLCRSSSCTRKKQRDIDDCELNKSRQSLTSSTSLTSRQSFISSRSQTFIEEDIPFSINYIDMTRNNPKGIQQLFKATYPCSSLTSRVGGQQPCYKENLSNYLL